MESKKRKRKEITDVVRREMNQQGLIVYDTDLILSVIRQES